MSVICERAIPDFSVWTHERTIVPSSAADVDTGELISDVVEVFNRTIVSTVTGVTIFGLLQYNNGFDLIKTDSQSTNLVARFALITITDQIVATQQSVRHDLNAQNKRRIFLCLVHLPLSKTNDGLPPGNRVFAFGYHHRTRPSTLTSCPTRPTQGKRLHCRLGFVRHRRWDNRPPQFLRHRSRHYQCKYALRLVVHRHMWHYKRPMRPTPTTRNP